MSELEILFGSMTVGDLCNKASISVSALMQLVLKPSAVGTSMHASPATPRRDGGRGKKTVERLTPDWDKAIKEDVKRAAKKSGPRVPIGNLASPAERQRFDDSILTVLRNASVALKIDEILQGLPWTNITRDQLSRAMPRLRDEGKITATGKTQARVYALVKN